MPDSRLRLRAASLSDQIKDMLVERIVSGDLQPGDRLVELSIAKAAGTSQAPVREALRQLEGLGLIAFRRNRGAVVRAFSAAELVEIYAVRAELEGFAAELLARNAPQVGADLLALCDQMERAEVLHDRAAFVDLNTDFHRTIVSACGNQTVLGIWETLDVQTRTMLNTAQTTDHLAGARQDHRKIAQAILDGASEQARALLRAHINDVARAAR